MVVRAAWSYTVETTTQAIRLVLGGVFDACPRQGRCVVSLVSTARARA